MDRRERRRLGARVCMLGIVAVLVLLSVEGGVGRAERVGATAMLSPRVNSDWMAPAGGGTETTVGTGLSQPQGVAVDRMGAVYIADFGHHRVVKVPAGGGAETAVGTGLSRPEGVAVDRTGAVYIADADRNQVVKVPADGGTQTTVVTDGDLLFFPLGVAVDGTGAVYIADTYDHRVVSSSGWSARSAPLRLHRRYLRPPGGEGARGRGIPDHRGQGSGLLPFWSGGGWYGRHLHR